MTAAATSPAASELLLKELTHRCSNDLQLVVAMLALEARQAEHEEVRGALERAAERVSILAHSRRAALQNEQESLEGALRHVCAGLNSQAAPRHIIVSLEASDGCDGMDRSTFVPVTLAVNELATNAIKHAFEEAKSGHISIGLRPEGETIVVTVDDDGLPFPELSAHKGSGTGLRLISRLVGSVGGSLQMPAPGTKLFKLMLPRSTNGSMKGANADGRP